jgi:glycine betaine/choline ABC-type transport system substrate-binding protein
VQNAAKSRGGYYLDSEKDFHSAANLGVSIRSSAMPGLTKKYGEDLKAALVGKTIKLVGQVRRVAVGKGNVTATQVEVTHAGQVLSVS